MMRFLYLNFFLVILVVGCSDPVKDGDSNSPSMESQTVMLSGLYADTVPGEEPGQRIYMEVLLNADSTFSMVKYAIRDEPGKPVPVNGPKSTLRGIYVAYDNWSRIKLTSTGDKGKATSFGIVKNALRLLDSNDKPFTNGGDYDLERGTRAVSTVGDFLLSYDEKPFSKYPAQVFTRTAGNNIRIHKPYLDQASAVEKALVSLYSIRYNTGCDKKGCAMNNALNMNDEQMRSQISEFISDTGPIPGTTPVERDRLTMLMIAKIGKGFQVHYAYLTAQDENYRAIDEYTVEGNVLKPSRISQPEPASKNK